MPQETSPKKQQEKHLPSSGPYNALLAPNEALRQTLQKLEPEIERKNKESLQKVKDACKDYLEWRRAQPPASQRTFYQRPGNAPERVQQRALEDLQAMFPRPVAVEAAQAEKGDQITMAQAAGQPQRLKNADDEASKSHSTVTASSSSSDQSSLGTQSSNPMNFAELVSSQDESMDNALRTNEM
ncbi:hypothetical protein KCU83_g571, partial [Aureobasidium melanogenum]